jgi:hypothetical protein
MVAAIQLTNPSNVLYKDSTTLQPVDVSQTTPLPVVQSAASFIASQPSQYETVAASQTAQVLGATGAVGDYLAGVLIIPATTAAGTVSIKDGNGSDVNVFVTGTLADLTPIYVSLGIRAVNATAPGWKVTTGANVSVLATGNFT